MSIILDPENPLTRQEEPPEEVVESRGIIFAMVVFLLMAFILYFILRDPAPSDAGRGRPASAPTSADVNPAPLFRVER